MQGVKDFAQSTAVLLPERTSVQENFKIANSRHFVSNSCCFASCACLPRSIGIASQESDAIIEYFTP